MRKQSYSHRLIIAFICVLLLVCSQLSLGAYCSLRDPIGAIRTLYPESDSHRSVVRTITNETRNDIAARLPFTLHFNEIGRHTLYVAQQQGRALGFVHARSELSDWGVIEIAWALTPTSTVQNFYFQRCRSPQCNDVLRRSVLEDIKHKSISEVLSLLTADGGALTEAMERKYSDSSSLVLALIRSSLKTRIATQIAWSKELEQVQRVAFVFGLIASAQSPRITPLGAEQKESLRLPKSLASMYSYLDKSSIEVFKVQNDDVEVARLVEARWTINDERGRFRWLFNREGRVLGLKHRDLMPTKEAALSFSALNGELLPSIENCATPAQISGTALFLNAYKKIDVY